MSIRKGTNRKNLKLDGFQIFIDCEWTKSNVPVSVQVNIINCNGYDKKFLVINSVY